MISKHVEILINADQTFVRFFPESEYVLAPTGIRRVGGKVRADEKTGFTLMVSAELGSSQATFLLPCFQRHKAERCSKAYANQCMGISQLTPAARTHSMCHISPEALV